ncbi:MAG: hypothetical protein QNJ31_06465 [Candidatus Caenarcaniphilales bacterium]|nr:hypothetical protein [Candidatus Caenarcaniphilales bacterium]
MSNKTLLLADNIHITKRNFESLIEFCEACNIKVIAPKHEKLPINVFGNYESLEEHLKIWIEELQKLNKDELFLYEYKNVNVFKVAKAELMSLICVHPQWKGSYYGDDLNQIFERAFEDNNKELILNMAAAIFWIDYWEDETKRISKIDYVGIFSGSLIYARALIEVMKSRRGRVFIMESFFTGQHYYCEEKYEPIANRSDIRHRTVYNSVKSLLPEERRIYEMKVRQTLQAIKLMKNKNVVQPESTGDKLFNNTNKTILILGQVVNDFSLLEVGQAGISSIAIYRNVIDIALSQTNLNIVFKAHPWERKKNNLKSAVTLNYLKSIYAEEDRIIFLENYAINDLFNQSNCVFCINSQSGIEAAINGFKPIQCGNAFYGGKGFTTDVNHKKLELDLPSIISNSLNWKLNIEEYNHLTDFLVCSLDKWLVKEKGWNSQRLKEIFYEVKPPAKLPAKPAAKPPSSVQNKAAEVQQNSELNKKLNSNFFFDLYRKAYSPFVSPQTRQQLIQDPGGFLKKARKPVSRFGRTVFIKGD